MTEAEELELLELEELEAQAAQAAPPVSVDAGGVSLGAGGTGLLNFGNWAGLNLTSPVAAALMAMGDVRADKTGRATFGDSYRRNLGFIDRTEQASNESHPLAKWLGRGLGVAAGAGASALGALTKAAPVAGAARPTLGALMKSGLGFGASAGAVAGIGANREQTPRGYVKAGGIGGTLGGLFGAAAPPAAASLGWLVRNAGAPAMKLLRGGFVAPTAEAQRLADKGAKLTLGQMDPNSPMGRLEELAAGKWDAGGVAEMRKRGISTARDALFQEAAAPGSAPPTRGATPFAQVDEIKAGFTKAYDDVLDGVKLWPEKYMGKGKWKGLLSGPNTTQGKGAFEVAADVAGAPPSVRERALAELTDLAQVLQPAKSGPNAGKVDARAVQELRTLIKDELRKFGRQGEDRYMRKIYERARDFTTELLEGQLPPEKAAKLRAVDAKYADRIAVDKATKGAGAFKAGGAGGEFTPTQLLEQIRKTGASPGLSALTRDAHLMSTATYTPTGMMAHALESTTPLAPYLAGPAAHIFNAVPALKQHAMRSTPWFSPGLPARAASAVGRTLESAGLEPRASVPAYRTLYDLLRPRPDPDEALQWTVTP